MLLLAKREPVMDHRPNHQSYHRGAALLITIIIICIICTILLSTQLILIRQSYQTTYGFQRNEQSIYNSLANIYDALWFRINNETPPSTAYVGYNNSNVTRTNIDSSTFESQTNLNDSSRRARATFNDSSIPLDNYADVVLILDKSASMGATSNANYAQNCLLNNNPANCDCLIPDASGLSSCEPLASLRSGMQNFYFTFTTPTSIPRFRIGTIFFGANGINPSFSEIISNSNNYYQFNNETELKNHYMTEIRPRLNYPNGYSNIQDAITKATTIFTSNRSDIPPGANYYQYEIVVTDGNPLAYGTTLPHTPCAVSPCPDAKAAAISAFNIASGYDDLYSNPRPNANRRCMLILGYGITDAAGIAELNSYLMRPGTSINDGPIILGGDPDPNCHPDLNIDIGNPLSNNPHILIVDSANKVGEGLLSIANAINDTLTTFTLQEINPQ